MENAAMDTGSARRSLLSPTGWVVFLAVGFLLIVLVPVLNQVVATGSAAHIPDYMIPLLGKYLCYALLAVSMDLIWGYAGILSLGHGAFFALGGYCMGMYLMRQIGDRGVYGNADLPDFMVFLNWKELPWYWYGFDNFAFAMLMVIVVPAVLAARASPASTSRSSPRRWSSH
jgi:urea transport system permease protein